MNDSRLIPIDVDAEKALLGSLMMQASVIEDVMPIVRAEMFSVDKHRLLYAAVLVQRRVVNRSSTP